MAAEKTIVRTDSLSTDRIDGSFEDDFICCPICCNVLWKPIACKTCENAFCMKCIRLWLKDNPNKCPFNCRFEERKPPPILLKILSKLRLTCRNKINGCPSMLSYEALEKHEQQECDYRLIQCPVCCKEILQKDSENHATNECPSREVTCLKCGSVYGQRDGHTEEQCLRSQINVLDEKLRDREEKPTKIMENYNKMVDLYNRHRRNADRSTGVASRNYSNDFSPSAPPAEEEAFATGTVGVESLDERDIPRGTLRISTINFNHMSHYQNRGASIENSYAGFNWENAYYITKSNASANAHLKGFRMAFRDAQENVAYNGRGGALTISLPNPEQRFGLHSFEAISIHHDELRLYITAYRSNVIFDTKNVMLSKDQLKLFEIDLEQVDRIVFRPAGTSDTLKPHTFALSTLNLVLP